MATQQEFDVFLAHNSKDKPQVTKIAQRLRNDCRLNPWLDDEQIPPGKSFQDHIQEAISSVKSSAIFIGTEGLGKWQSWELKALISQCVENKIPVIPVLLPGLGVDNWPKNLIFLKELRWVEFSKDIDDQKAIDLLVWGVTGNKPETITQLKTEKPGRIPKKEYLIDSVSKEIVAEQGSLYLEPLIMLTAIKKMIDNLTKEIRDGNFNLINKIPIFLPQEISNKLLIENILDKIKDKLLEKESLDKIKKKLKNSSFENDKQIIACHLIELLKNKKDAKALSDNYAAGNILNLLLQLNLKQDFSYFDLSNISIWETDLREAILTGVDFTDSDLKNSSFSKPLGCIHSIAFNADGSYFATGDAHGSIRVHNTDNLELCYFHANKRGSQIWSIAFSSGDKPQRLAWGAEDGSVRLFEMVIDRSSGKLDFNKTDLGLYNEQGRVLSVAFSPNGNTLAIGGDGKNDAIKLFNIQENKEKKQQNLPADNVSCITFINDDSLASGSNNGLIEIWDLKNSEKMESEQVHKGVIRCIAYNVEKRVLASGCEDGKVYLWRIGFSNEKPVELTLESAISQVRTLAFDKDGNTLAVGCIDNNHNGQSEHKILMWKFQNKNWEQIGKLDNSKKNGHEHLIRSVAFSPSPDRPRLLISGGDGRTVKLWDWDNENDKWKCKQTLRGYANRVWSVAFNNKRQIFACGGEDNKIRIWNYQDRTHIPTHTLSKHTAWVWSVAFNQDGTLLASGSEDYTIGLWQLENNEWKEIPFPSLQKHSKRVRCVAFHPTRDILASAGNDNKVILWDVNKVLTNQEESDKTLHIFDEHTDRILSLAFSPDGNYLASSSRNRTICLIKIQDINICNVDSNWENNYKEQQHKDQVHSIAFNPDSNLLVSGGFDDTLKLWEIPSGRCICSWGGDQKILSVAFHPNGEIVASAGDQHFITLWDISNNSKPKELKRLKGHKRTVESLVFSPDGKRLISCSQDQTIKFWEIDGEINISIHTIELGKPYQGMNISGVKNLETAQISALEELGASRNV